MTYKYVETITSQNLKLSGCLTGNNSSKSILYIPGLAGNFFETKYTRVLAKELLKKEYDFLFAHNQGSFQVFEVPFLTKVNGNQKQEERHMKDLKIVYMI